MRESDPTTSVTVLARDVHNLALARCGGSAGSYVSDADLDAIAAPNVTTLAAVELCIAGVWRRTDGGYVVGGIGGSRALRTLAAVGRRVWTELTSERFIP